MTNDPAEADIQEIRRLKAFAPLFRKGWVKLHPIPDKHRALIDNAFSKSPQERAKQAAKAKLELSNKLRLEREEKKQKKSEQSQTQTKGPRHSH